MKSDKYTTGSGTNCDYLYLNGKHFLKTVGDSIATTTEVRKVCAMLNQFDALTKVAEAAKDVGLLLESYATIKRAVGDRGEFSRFNRLDLALAALERAKEGK